MARFEGVHADLPLRETAALLLDRAVQLRPQNAAAWFEYGLAIKKRGGLQVDAYRAINHALSLADQYPESTPPSLLAEIQFERARHLQDWVDRFRDLRDGSRLAIASPQCSNLGLFCENYTRPVEFNQQVMRAPLVGTDLSEQRDRLMQLYRLVLRLDSSNTEAAERLGRELALGEEWEALTSFGAMQAERGTESAFFHAVQALALYRQGRPAQADSVFALAVAALSDSMRRWYDAPAGELAHVGDFWRRSRPLWLTPFNELRLEYWARLTDALLVFGDREAGVAGPETPQGDALIRYGWPNQVSQVSREGSTLLSPEQMAAAIAATLDCAPKIGGDRLGMGLPQCGQAAPSGAGDPGGGRWVIWTYAADRPSFIFEQRPGLRVPHYVFDGAAETYAHQVREKTPLAFTSQLVRRTFKFPVQVARFQSELAGATTLALFGLVPARAMGLRAGDSLSAGLFVFRDTTGFPTAASQRGVFAPGEALALTYRVPLSPGQYAYSIEAYAPAPALAAVARDSVTAPVWTPDSLQMSDILIALRVDQTGGTVPTTWRDLLIDPSRTLSVTPGSALWLVWETYGLQPDANLLGHYHVALGVQDANTKSLPLRLLARLGVGARSSTSAVTLEWDAERLLSPDGRALEYVSIQLPAEAQGAYRLTVSITDSTGRTVRAVRPITILSPAGH